MDVGLHLADFGRGRTGNGIAPLLADVATNADRSGFTDISVMDHFLQIDTFGDGAAPMLEAYTTLGFLAAHTSKVRLQTLVTGVTYRYPGILAKTVTTLDVLSGGRAGLGIGAAWYRREHEAMGVPFPPTRERFERLEETLRIVLQMWSSDDGPYRGTHFQLAETLNSPEPVRRPQLMIGGNGEKRTLRLVARYGDACNVFVDPRQGVEMVRTKMEVLRRHCATEGTDYDRIRKTMLYSAPVPLQGAEVDSFVENMASYAALGVSTVFLTRRRDPAEFARQVGEVIVPRLAGLPD